MPPPTIRDVARIAGVSLGTVSRVLNDNKSVTSAVRERVRHAIIELGYERNAVAQSMRRQTTQTVACAIRDFSIPGFAAFVKAAEAIFREIDYTLLLANTGNQKEIELTLMRTFAQRRVDGVMMTISDESDAELVAAITRATMPVVLIDRDLVTAVDRVAVDHRAGTCRAVEYLLSLGHRRIALLTGAPVTFPARARIEGFNDAFRAAGLTPEPGLIRAQSFSNEFAFRETAAILGSANRPSALIIGGMDMLAGALRAIELSGLAIGRDISLISCSDSDLAELTTPAITAVRWDLAEMGRYAAEMLIERIRTPRTGAPRYLRVPAMLIVRNSCRPV